MHIKALASIHIPLMAFTETLGLRGELNCERSPLTLWALKLGGGGEAPP